MVQNRVFLDKINMKMFFHKRQVCEGEILWLREEGKSRVEGPMPLNFEVIQKQFKPEFTLYYL